MWSHDGIICTGETYKSVVKLTFAKGASLEDPSGLFNSSLEGNTRRAIDIHEGDKIDEEALKALIRAAVALNTVEESRREGEILKPDWHFSLSRVGEGRGEGRPVPDEVVRATCCSGERRC